MNNDLGRTGWERALDFIGIHHRPRGGWNLSIRPRFFISLGISGLAFLASIGGVARYSESPQFCHSCHIMEPYYQAWKTSKHNKVACVECHYPPGSPRTLLWKKFQALSQVAKYVTRTYSSKPFAEVDDASCLQCHSTRLLEGKVVTEHGIIFDHRPHLMETRRGRRLKCVSCHSQVVVGRHIEVTYETCYLCHFKGRGEGREFKPLGDCSGCHQLPSKTFEIGNMKFNHKTFVSQRGLSCQNCHLDVVKGQGNVPEDRCLTCHNQTEKLAKFKETSLIHDNHVTKHNIACFHCHETIQHGLGGNGKNVPADLGMPDARAAAEAPAVHSATLAFDCAFCHQKMHAGQLEMYTGQAQFLGLPRMPSPMYAANVDCVGCHYMEKRDSAQEFHGKTFKASGTACTKCHGVKFKGIWEETRTELESTLGQLLQKEESVAKALDASAAPPSGKEGMKRELAKARRLRAFVKNAKGEHNIYLASVSLRRANDALSKLSETLGAQGQDLSALPLLSGSFCATMCHERVGVRVPPETVRVFGKTMPHKMHTEIMGCVKCHDIGTHKSVPLRKDVKEICQGCHAQ